MSHHPTNTKVSADYFDSSKAKSLAVASGVIGLVLLAISVGYGLTSEANTKQLAFSWLWAVVYFFTIACGALFWTFVHFATDAEWSTLIRRQLENIARQLPVIAVLFAGGIFFFAPLLYSWWTMDPATDSLLKHKQGFLNHTAFYVRAAFYFVALCVLAILVRRNSVAQDENGEARFTLKNRKLSFIGIPVVALGLTFAAIDWLMALDFRWFSTMWGVYIFAGGAGSAMSLLVLIVTWLRKNGHLKLITIEHYHIMGKLMLAFCVFWAYIGYSQYMLIWYANMPEETTYFIRRTTESWWYLSLALVIGRFFVPFPFLLLQATKKNPKYLCFVAGWLLVMQALDLYIVVLPILHMKGYVFSLLDITTFIGVAGIVVSGFFFTLSKKSSLFPVRDPRIAESISLSN